MIARIDENISRNEVPFPDEIKAWAYPWMDEKTISIKAAKSMINLMFKWKRSPDRNGKFFVFEEHGEAITKAIACLYEYKIIDQNECKLIVRFLSSGKFE